MTLSFTQRIIRIAGVAALILVVPLLGTQFVDGWNWSLSDFVVAGVVLFIFGVALDTVWRKAGTYRLLAACVVVVLFLWLWVELAVGLFTNWGS